MTAPLNERNPRKAFDRWSIMLGVLLIAVLLSAVLYLRDEFPMLQAEGSVASNVGFFLLINLNIVVVMILGFLVAKNIIKLVLDRKRNILGSKLRTRLVVAFVGLSLIPTVLLFTVAKGILERVLQGWFSPQVAASVDGALGVAQLYYQGSEAQLQRQMNHLSNRLADVIPLLIQPGDEGGALKGEQPRTILSGYLEKKRQEYGMFELSLLDPKGTIVLRAASHAAEGNLVERPSANAAAVYRALSNDIVIQPEQSLNGEFLRGYAAVSFPAFPPGENIDFQSPEASEQQQATLVLSGTLWIPPELSKTLSAVINAHDDYNELKTYRRPLASSYFLTLVVVTLLIIFAAIWVGFYLARGVSVPIALVAEGTQQIAHGNLDYRIPEIGDDELSLLVRSFNTMTHDLKETTEELVSGRRYMETVLARVGVGVISLDFEGRVTTCNMAAGEILGLSDAKGVHGKSSREVFPELLVEHIVQMTDELYSQGRNSVSKPFSLTVQSTPKHLQLTLSKLVGEAETPLGVVVLVDDITQLVSAQRMSAWREVARRIAHEIKNPLTPIQLSAQRIQRKFGGEGDSLLRIQLLKDSDKQMIQESTTVIVRQVEILRTLVNEFSRFARMPKVHLQVANIANVIEETVAFFREAHPGVSFQCSIDPQVPEFPLDAEQIHRTLVNLLDNSVASVGSEAEKHLAGSYTGTIQVECHYNESLSMVSLIVADNGIGIPAEDRPRLFEPYFSTKPSGTGLGLAIVSTIVADHNGFIRVRDNSPRGARVIIELPVAYQALQKHA